MANMLPIFPLELVVFPSEPLHLHIFEPRYKQLIQECRDTGAHFGIPARLHGKIADFGTEVALQDVFRTYPGGEMDIRVNGLRAFALHAWVPELPGKLYGGAEVSFVANDPSVPAAVQDELVRQYKRLETVLQADPAREAFTGPNLSFALASQVGLSLEQKVRLLSISTEADRQRMLIDHLGTLVPVVESARDTSRRVRGNGHFKTIPKIDFS